MRLPAGCVAASVAADGSATGSSEPDSSKTDGVAIRQRAGGIAMGLVALGSVVLRGVPASGVSASRRVAGHCSGGMWRRGGRWCPGFRAPRQASARQMVLRRVEGDVPILGQCGRRKRVRWRCNGRYRDGQRRGGAVARRPEGWRVAACQVMS